MLAETLRRAGISCVLAQPGSLKKQLREADKAGAQYAVWISDE